MATPRGHDPSRPRAPVSDYDSPREAGYDSPREAHTIRANSRHTRSVATPRLDRDRGPRVDVPSNRGPTREESSVTAPLVARSDINSIVVTGA